MEEYREVNDNENNAERAPMSVNRWLIVAVVALLVVAGLAFGYGYRQQILVGHLTAEGMSANATIGQMQGQLNTLTAKLNEMSAAQAAKAPSESPKQAASKTASGRAATKRAAPADKRYKQLQTQLEVQQKQLKETQEEVAKNRSDLEGNLNSTRDELNGSIARTHEELVALQKRGERNYFEFDLTKSKQYQRIGPLTLSLRRVDPKHKNYDLQLIIEDSQVSKKRVNVYEPIWIHMENEGQPVQVVVNRVEKNQVHGYVSAPKYKASELAAASAASITPVSAKTPATDAATPNPPKPEQPEPPPIQPEPPQPQQ